MSLAKLLKPLEVAKPPRPERKVLEPNNFTYEIRYVLHIIRDQAMHVFTTGEKPLNVKYLMKREATQSSIEEVHGSRGWIFPNWKLVGILQCPREAAQPILFYEGGVYVPRGSYISDIVVHDRQALRQWDKDHPDCISRGLERRGLSYLDESDDKVPEIYVANQFQSYSPIAMGISVVHAGIIEKVNTKERKL